MTGDFAMAETLGERGQAYLASGQYAAAWAEFNRAVELQPNLAWVVGGRGEANRRLGRFNEALADFERVIQILPEGADGFAMRGDTYRVLERYDEARADFNRALELNPHCALAIEGRGLLPRMTYQAALQLAEQMGALEPQTLAERAAAGVGGFHRPFSESDWTCPDLVDG